MPTTPFSFFTIFLIALPAILAVDVVNIGTAGDFVLLAAAGVSTVPASAIFGNVGVSPIAATAMTGFALTADSTNTFSTSTQVTGKLYAANYAVPTPAKMTTAIGDMQAAYTAVASRVTSKGNLNLLSGSIGGQTFKAGVYTWKMDVEFGQDIILTGSKKDVFIFQTTGNVRAIGNAKVILQGGVQATNVFWQMAGQLEAGKSSHLEGIFLVKNAAIFMKGASLYGRVLSQKAITLIQNTLTSP
jgi:hypothetical protein